MIKEIQFLYQQDGPPGSPLQPTRALKPKVGDPIPETPLGIASEFYKLCETLDGRKTAITRRPSSGSRMHRNRFFRNDPHLRMLELLDHYAGTQIMRDEIKAQVPRSFDGELKEPYINLAINLGIDPNRGIAGGFTKEAAQQLERDDLQLQQYILTSVRILTGEIHDSALLRDINYFFEHASQYEEHFGEPYTVEKPGENEFGQQMTQLAQNDIGVLKQIKEALDARTRT